MNNSFWRFKLSLLGFLVLGTLFSTSQAAIAFVPWWDSVEQTKPKLFRALDEKVGKVELPKYPVNDVLQWSSAQYSEPKPNPKERVKFDEYKRKVGRAIYEHILVAEDILQKANKISDLKVVAQQHRRVIQLAEVAALRANVVMRDDKLAARIRETYQLPYLESATSNGQDPISKESIVSSVSGDYNRTGERDEEIAALKALVEVATTRNSADSARSKLAQAYAANKDYERAIAYLEAIRDPSISGAKKLIPQYQALQAKQRTPKPHNDKM